MPPGGPSIYAKEEVMQTMWTKARLEAFAWNRLSGHKFVVVSNRQPYVHMVESGEVVCAEPAGGLTAALKPIVASLNGTWVAQANGTADRQTADRYGRLAVPPADPAFTLRRLWVPDELQRGYYDGLSNQALWPLCHNVYRRPSFRRADWEAYKRVNELFADAVLEEM